MEPMSTTTTTGTKAITATGAGLVQIVAGNNGSDVDNLQLGLTSAHGRHVRSA